MNEHVRYSQDRINAINGRPTINNAAGVETLGSQAGSNIRAENKKLKLKKKSSSDLDIEQCLIAIPAILLLFLTFSLAICLA